MSLGQAFECDDGFLDLYAFLLQFGEHLQDVKLGTRPFYFERGALFYNALTVRCSG
jgi:hypothetical protein